MIEVTLQEAYATACQLLGEQLVEQRLTASKQQGTGTEAEQAR